MAISSNASRLRQVGEDKHVEEPETPVALNLLLLALQALGQRALVALATLGQVAALGTVWWLFNTALPHDPSINQLAGLSTYSAFVLAVLWITRRR